MLLGPSSCLVAAEAGVAEARLFWTWASLCCCYTLGKLVSLDTSSWFLVDACEKGFSFPRRDSYGTMLELKRWLPKAAVDQEAAVCLVSLF